MSKLIISLVIILLTSSPVYAWFSSPSGFGGSPSGFGTPEPIEEPAVEEPEIIEPEIEEEFIEVFTEPEVEPQIISGTGEWLNDNGFFFSSPSGFSPVAEVYESPSEVVYTAPEPPTVEPTLAEVVTVEPVKPASNKDIITADKAPNEVYNAWFAHSPTAKPALPTTSGNGFLFWIGLLAIACGIGLIILIERGK